MKIVFRAFVFMATCACAHSTSSGITARFCDYPAEAYTGPLRIPDYYKKSDDEWRDDAGKLMAPPDINFAGKYFIGLHSCGGGCRYYTLSDLEKGIDSNALDTFSSDGDRPQTTSDGRMYITNIISRPRSKMLIAQYHIEKSEASKEECREKAFLLSDDGKQIKPITKIINFCAEIH